MIEERFARGESILHKTDPKVKIIGSMGLALIVALSQSLIALYSGLLGGIVLLFIAKLRYHNVLKHLLAVNLFIIFLWLVLPLTGAQDIDPLIYIGPVPIYEKGIEIAHRVTVKANAITLFIITLLATSTIQQIGYGLRQLGFSKKFIFLLLASWRYLGLIRQEYTRLNRAATLRCFRPSANFHTYRTYGYLIGMTFIHSYNRAQRVNNAMLLRGFNGVYPVFDTSVIRSSDYIIACILTGYALLLITLSFI